MKRIIFATLLIFSSAFFLSSCLFIGPSIKGNGNIVEEVRETTGFTSIKASRGVNVYISQAGYEGVKVKADENLLNVIETKVDDGVLIITTNKRIKNATACKIFVDIKNMEKVSAFAGSNVYSESRIDADVLDISSSAGSNIKLEVSSNTMEVSASAGSNIFLEGRAGNVKLKASAGSNIKASGLIAKICKAKANSGANVYIAVDESFDAKANSGGNVFYSGNPSKLTTSNSSGGNVRKTD